MFFSVAVSSLPQLGQIINNLVLSPCLSLGIVIYAYRVHTDEKREASNLFDGFAHWLKIFQFSSILMVAVLIALAPLLHYVMGNIDATSPELMLESWNELSLTSTEKVICGISIFAALVVSVLLGFTPLFIGFYELDPITAVKYSYRFVSINWLPILCYVIIVGLIAVSGVILLGFGILITFSIAFPMQYAAFEQMTVVTEYFIDEETPDSVDEMF